MDNTTMFDLELTRCINREIRRIVGRLGRDDYESLTFGFVCECGCRQRVELTAHEYDARAEVGVRLAGHRGVEHYAETVPQSEAATPSQRSRSSSLVAGNH